MAEKITYKEFEEMKKSVEGLKGYLKREGNYVEWLEETEEDYLRTIEDMWDLDEEEKLECRVGPHKAIAYGMGFELLLDKINDVIEHHCNPCLMDNPLGLPEMYENRYTKAFYIKLRNRLMELHKEMLEDPQWIPMCPADDILMYLINEEWEDYLDAILIETLPKDDITIFKGFCVKNWNFDICLDCDVIFLFEERLDALDMIYSPGEYHFEKWFTKWR